MTNPAVPATGGYQSATPRERAVSAVLALLIILIALLIALTQTVGVPQFGDGHALVSFNVGQDNGAPAKAKAQPKAEQHAVERHQVPSVGTIKPRLVVSRPHPQTAIEGAIPGFIAMSGSDLAAADIGHMPPGAKAGGGGNAQVGPGEGPGGVHLYNADWYRRPTDAQLGGYLHAGMPPSGYGTIACQTIDHYHVDNCAIIDEAPLGSGYGRAVQNAAWQFLVIPPRVNSQTQIGAWVRIRITYSTRGHDPG